MWGKSHFPGGSIFHKVEVCQLLLPEPEIEMGGLRSMVTLERRLEDRLRGMPQRERRWDVTRTVEESLKLLEEAKAQGGRLRW